MSAPEAAFNSHALVLAAGAGTRFAGEKLLADFRGEPLVTWAVRAALATTVRSVTVVLGSRTDDVEAGLSGMACPRLRIVRNPDWRGGLSTSLRCGLASLPLDTSAVLVFLGDMPNVSPALGDEVLRAVMEGAPAAYPMHAGQPGHPVALARALFPALERLEGDTGARDVLRGMAGVRQIDTSDPGCIQDVDSTGDLAALSKRITNITVES